MRQSITAILIFLSGITFEQSTFQVNLGKPEWAISSSGRGVVQSAVNDDIYTVGNVGGGNAIKG